MVTLHFIRILPINNPNEYYYYYDAFFGSSDSGNSKIKKKAQQQALQDHDHMLLSPDSPKRGSTILDAMMRGGKRITAGKRNSIVAKNGRNEFHRFYDHLVPLTELFKQQQQRQDTTPKGDRDDQEISFTPRYGGIRSRRDNPSTPIKLNFKTDYRNYERVRGKYLDDMDAKAEQVDSDYLPPTERQLVDYENHERCVYPSWTTESSYPTCNLIHELIIDFPYSQHRNLQNFDVSYLK